MKRIILALAVLGAVAAMAGRAGADILLQSSDFQDIRAVYVLDGPFSGYGYNFAAQDAGGTSSYNGTSVTSSATTAGTSTSSSTALTLQVSVSSSLSVSAGAFGNQSNNVMESDQFFSVSQTGSYNTMTSLTASSIGATDPSIQALAYVKILDITTSAFVYEQMLATLGTVGTIGSIPSPFTLTAGDSYELIGQVTSQGALDNRTSPNSSSFTNSATATFSLTSTAVPEPASLALMAIGCAGAIVVANRSRRKTAAR